MSPTTSPVTLSLKVMVTGIGVTLVGSAAVEVMITEGTELSKVLDKILEALLPFVAASTALFTATLTDTNPIAVGVMLAV